MKLFEFLDTIVYALITGNVKCTKMQLELEKNQYENLKFELQSNRITADKITFDPLKHIEGIMKINYRGFTFYIKRAN